MDYFSLNSCELCAAEPIFCSLATCPHHDLEISMHAAHSLTKYTRSTCKDLCYWVFYPFYCFPFTHTNSNWL